MCNEAEVPRLLPSEAWLELSEQLLRPEPRVRVDKHIHKEAKFMTLSPYISQLHAHLVQVGLFDCK